MNNSAREPTNDKKKPLQNPIPEYHSSDPLTVLRDGKDLNMMMIRIDKEIEKQKQAGTIDTTGCDAFFLDGFITQSMKEDFPYVMQDYLRHKKENDTHDIKAMYTSIMDDYPDPFYRECVFLLNVLYEAAKEEDPLAVEILQRLYKTYYGKEYRQFKRFQVITLRNYYDLCKNEENGMDFHTLARILVMSRIFHKEDQDAQIPGYYFLNEAYQEELEKSEREKLNQEELKEDWRLKIMELLSVPSVDDDKIDSIKIQNILAFMILGFQKSGFDISYVPNANDGDVNPEELADVLALMQESPLFDEEIALPNLINYLKVYRLVGTVVDYIWQLSNTWFIAVWDIDQRKGSSENTKTRYKQTKSPPEKLIPLIKNASIRKLKAHEIQPVREEHVEEVQRLKQQVKLLEQEVTILRDDCRYVKQKNSQLIKENEKYKEREQELYALRQYLYQLTEDDSNPEHEISLDQIQEGLSKYKVLIIGGHPNWRKKFRLRMPEWQFLVPTSNTTINTSIVYGTEHVYFFTDILDHPTYYRFMHVIQENRIPFGYLHSVNIDTALKQIYQDLCEKEKT